VGAREPSQGEFQRFDLSPVTSTKILIYREARTVFAVEGGSFKEVDTDPGGVRVRTLLVTQQQDLAWTAVPRLGTNDALPRPVSELDPDFPVEVTSAPWLSFGSGMVFDLRSKTLHRFDPTAGQGLDLSRLIGLAPGERTLYWIGAAENETQPYLVATDIVSGAHQVFKLNPRHDDIPYDGHLQFNTEVIDGAWIVRHFRSEPQADGSLRLTRRSARELVPRGAPLSDEQDRPTYALSCFKPSLRAAVGDLLREEFQAKLLSTKTFDRSQDISLGRYACGASPYELHGFQYTADKYEVDGVPIDVWWEGRGTLTISGDLTINDPPDLRWRGPARAMIVKAIGDAINARLASGAWRHHLL
jgi:hypothetical protein